MSKCDICRMRKTCELILFEDDDVSVFLTETPAGLGHVIVTTKKHFENLEKAPDYLFAWAFTIANKVSKVMLESVNMQGLNLLIEVGKVGHPIINLVPRFENDNLGMKWDPKPGDQEELKTVQLMYESETKSMGVSEDKPKSAPQETKSDDKEISDKEDYRIKQLLRIP
jgi:histidine triad (HIT) family protein